MRKKDGVDVSTVPVDISAVKKKRMDASTWWWIHPRWINKENGYIQRGVDTSRGKKERDGYVQGRVLARWWYIEPGGGIPSKAGEYSPGGGISSKAGEYSPGGGISSEAGEYSPGGGISSEAGEYSPGGVIPSQAGKYSPGGGIPSQAGEYLPGGGISSQAGEYSPGGTHQKGPRNPQNDLILLPTDWYEHKIRYLWLLPGYNESLSLFPPGFWIQTPNHTNLVESAHVATNDQTGTKLMPLEAIQRARAFDRARAESICASRETCIPVNRNNSDTSRMQRSVSRAARRKQHHTQHSELENNILEKKKQLKELQSEKKGKVEFIDDAGSSAPSQSRPSSSMDYIDVDAIDYQSDRQQPDYFSAPPSSSSGFDLVSRASDFDSEPEGTADWDATMPEEDADSVPHVGYYLLGAPGFDLDEFLAACGSAEAGI
ncbi:hypothetical protein C8R43DRAFT_959206 [Mycena crocata]|nr:hypothetical protein C8R43DRAFT_959206 [Mycena crocata]